MQGLSPLSAPIEYQVRTLAEEQKKGLPLVSPCAPKWCGLVYGLYQLYLSRRCLPQAGSAWLPPKACQKP